MKTVRIENHQPVPLKPIKDVMETTHVMWVGPIALSDDSDDMGGIPVGWVRRGINDEWIELEDAGRYRSTYIFFLESYGIDLDRTLARPIQPGEKIVIELTG